MVALKGGDKLEAKLRALSSQVTKAASVDVGFLAGSTYPDGTSVPMVAAIQEFGAPSRGIPPRPFFRGMIQKESPKWGDTVATLLHANNYDAARTLAQAGDGIKGQLQQSIVDFTTPALAQSTIDRKGFDIPLVDTGHMLNSVDYVVKK